MVGLWWGPFFHAFKLITDQQPNIQSPHDNWKAITSLCSEASILATSTQDSPINTQCQLIKINTFPLQLDLPKGGVK